MKKNRNIEKTKSRKIESKKVIKEKRRKIKGLNFFKLKK